MYVDFFGLDELPFGITPDTSYTYLSRGHQEALNTLLLAIESGEGFIKVTGEVGTGKTLLCRRLMNALTNEVQLAYLPNPYMGPQTLMLALAEELGLGQEIATDEYHVLKAINQALLQFAEAERQVIVLIDEAQAMPVETLEALRLLSNMETEKRKLLQIILMGQPELDIKLADQSVRQLRQRIAFNYHLPTLSSEETASYLEHRLRVAGYRSTPIFEQKAVRAMHQSSRGTPRLLNILAHKSLLAAFGEASKQVSVRHVRLAARDTPGSSRIGWWLR